MAKREECNSVAANLLIFTVSLLVIGWLFLNGKVAKQLFARTDQRLRYLFGAATIAGLIVTLPMVLARLGILAEFTRMPPPLAIFFIYLLLAPLFLARSRWGQNLLKVASWRGIIFFQAFRILAELIIFFAVHEGIAPVALSVEGYNFDLLTGLSALLLGGLGSEGLAKKWSIGFSLMGIAFLLVIAFIAMTSMPSPLRLFMSEPSNIWVSQNPYVLLPGVLVFSAWFGHWLIWFKWTQQRP